MNRYVAVIRSYPLRRIHLLNEFKERGFLLLLLSTILAEIAGNSVYVILLEKAYKLDKVVGVGGVLLVQAVPQVLLGMWAGSLVDRLGKRRAAVLATIFNGILVAGLVVGKTISIVYILAFLIMLARLLLIPARLALVSYTSHKANLMATNTAISFVTSLGLFIGPALSAALMLHTKDFQLPLLVAIMGVMLSLPPLLFVPTPSKKEPVGEQSNIWIEMRTGWQFIRQHYPIRRVLICLVHITLIMGAIMPLITSLAHDLGLGSEGSGIFFSAIGLGGLVGAVVAVMQARWQSPSAIIFLSGLVIPVGAVFIGLLKNLESILIAIALIHLADASLSIIVITILQRLTPLKMQGYVFGVVQTLLGITWTISLATVTGGKALWPQTGNTQKWFLLIGGVGTLTILTCLLWYRSQIKARISRKMKLLGDYTVGRLLVAQRSP